MQVPAESDIPLDGISIIEAQLCGAREGPGVQYMQACYTSAFCHSSAVVIPPVLWPVPKNLVLASSLLCVPVVLASPLYAPALPWLVIAL